MEVRLGGVTAGSDPVRLVMEAHWDFVEAVCRRHLAGMRIEDIHDARQDTFLQFMDADKEAIRDVRAWLATVAHRTCDRVILRRRYRDVELASRQAATERTPPCDFAQTATDRLAVASVVAQLTPLERSVIALLYQEQLPHAEIARRLGRTEHAIEQTALRARGRIRRLLTHAGDELADDAILTTELRSAV
jgi:RNA polymerase sigma-70 factor (ECF subfamily)